jgi:hypothetical protein
MQQDSEVICKRAGGRRKYNAWRKFIQTNRRHLVARRIYERGCYHGMQAELAWEFGVSRAAMCRDIA